MISLDVAKKEVSNMFEEISPIVEKVVSSHSRELDRLIHNLTKTAALTNSEIRDYMLAISSEAYVFGIVKDSTILMQECSTTLLKERQAQSYNKTDGTQQVRTNQSYIDAMDKQVVSMIYSAVANMMKTKLDEAHRMVNTLNSILISRNAEAKISASDKQDESQNPFRALRSDEDENIQRGELI